MLDANKELIGPWKLANIGRRVNCPLLPGPTTGTYRPISKVTSSDGMSLERLLAHVRDRRTSDKNQLLDDHWVRLPKKILRASTEATKVERTPPKRKEQRSDAEKRDSKRIKESKSQLGTAMTAGEGDDLVLMPTFITAQEHREKKEKDRRSGCSTTGRGHNTTRHVSRSKQWKS
jgi:hypothetical protein